MRSARRYGPAVACVFHHDRDRDARRLRRSEGNEPRSALPADSSRSRSFRRPSRRERRGGSGPVLHDRDHQGRALLRHVSTDIGASRCSCGVRPGARSYRSRAPGSAAASRRRRRSSRRSAPSRSGVTSRVAWPKPSWASTPASSHRARAGARLRSAHRKASCAPISIARPHRTSGRRRSSARSARSRRCSKARTRR